MRPGVLEAGGRGVALKTGRRMRQAVGQPEVGQAAGGGGGWDALADLAIGDPGGPAEADDVEAQRGEGAGDAEDADDLPIERDQHPGLALGLQTGQRLLSFVIHPNIQLVHQFERPDANRVTIVLRFHAAARASVETLRRGNLAQRFRRGQNRTRQRMLRACLHDARPAQDGCLG